MIQLIAIKPLSGSYGHVHPGQVFSTNEAAAMDLESRGLAYRYFSPAPIQRNYDTASFMPQYATKAIVPDEVKPITAKRKR
jgi:hypothetical protein